MGRQSALDGLRGILAFAVMLCHATVWRHFLSTGSWACPDTGLCGQLGTSSVYMFFMITGFLFTSKIIHDRKKGVDWVRLFTSRVLRIVPLYFISVLLMVFIVLIESNFQIKESWADFLLDIVQWLTFTIFNEPLLNNYVSTGAVNAHVQWTLVYEWLFYVSLPLLALILHSRVSMLYIILSAALLLLFAMNIDNLFLPRAFLAGILTAFIFEFGLIKLQLSRPVFSLIAIALVAFQAWYSPEFVYQQPSRIPSLCLTIAFIIITCGNNLFGLLSSKPTRYLGEVSYGIYLLHGIILFCVFKYIVGFEYVKGLSPISYWSLVSIVGALILIASTFSYRTIEAPAMRRVSEVSAKVKAMFSMQS